MRRICENENCFCLFKESNLAMHIKYHVRVHTLVLCNFISINSLNEMMENVNEIYMQTFTQ
jgi:hypothetical protein